LTHIAWQPHTIIWGYGVTREVVPAGELLDGFYAPQPRPPAGSATSIQ
jgi:hypothetical protein